MTKKLQIVEGMYCQEARDTAKLSCYYDIVIKVYFNRTLIIMAMIKVYIFILLKVEA